MKEHFEKLTDFTLKQKGITGRARVLFLSADQWKKFAKEKNDLAIQYELLTKKCSIPGSLAVPPVKIICLIGDSSLYFCA